MKSRDELSSCLDSGSRSGSKVFTNWNITPKKGFNEMFLVSIGTNLSQVAKVNSFLGL